jgi:hypothetical protein
MKHLLTVLFFTIIAGPGPEKEMYDSFHPGKEWKDNNGVHINAHGGGITYFGEKYYWYGEHKVQGRIGNSAQVGVRVYSSRDLYNWKDEGIALSVDEKDPSSEIAKGCIIERPKVIYNRKSGKFVMWFHLELKGHGYDAARAGVAISDSPVGPFTYIRSCRPDAGYWPVNVGDHHKRPVSDSVKDKYCGGKGCLPGPVDSVNILGRDFRNGQMSRDMTLFVDDDGTAYHIFSSEENSTLHISRLSDDYLTHTGIYTRVFMDRYMEAPTILKTSEGKYFFIGSDCTGWDPNAARSATADHISGPWKELGNPCTGKDSAITFGSQGTFLLPVQGKKDAFIFMADQWTPENPVDGKYIWLPISFNGERIVLEWKDEWDLGTFN